MALGVPSWSVYSATYSEADGWGTERDPVLAGYVEHLGGVVKGLAEDVHTVESRQVALDRRLAEFGGLLQGLQEEHLAQVHGEQALHAAVGQQARHTAGEVQQALQTAVEVKRRIEEEGELNNCLQGLSEGWAKRLEQLCQQQGRWLLELNADVATLRSQSNFAAAAAAEARGVGTELALNSDQMTNLDARIAALEQGQKTVAVGARRALHTALVVHQQQQSQDHDNQWEKCLDALPVAELEQQTSRRFVEQDDRLDKALGEQEGRLDKVVQMVDLLTDRVLMQQAVSDELSEGRTDLEAKITQKLDSLDAGLFALQSEVESCRVASDMTDHSLEVLAAKTPRETSTTLNQMRDFMAAALEQLETRLRRSLGEVDSRLDLLQDGRDQQKLSLRQLGQTVPEVSQKLDQLWSQCQYYFPRVKEHDVHFGFFRNSFEAHKQSMLDAADGIDHREHRAAAAAVAARSSGESRQPPLASSFATPLFQPSALFQQVFVEPSRAAASRPASRPSSRRPSPSPPDGTGLLSDLGSATSRTSPPRRSELGAGRDAAETRASWHTAGPGSAVRSALAAGGGPLVSGRGAAIVQEPARHRTAGEEDDAELRSRTKMLEQIMARLHGRDVSGAGGEDRDRLGVGSACGLRT